MTDPHPRGRPSACDLQRGSRSRVHPPASAVRIRRSSKPAIFDRIAEPSRRRFQTCRTRSTSTPPNHRPGKVPMHFVGRRADECRRLRSVAKGKQPQIVSGTRGRRRANQLTSIRRPVRHGVTGCSVEVFGQQRAITSAACGAPLVKVDHACSIAAKGQPSAIGRPDRGGCHTAAGTNTRLAPALEIGDPEVDDAGFWIDQRRREACLIGRQPEIRVIALTRARRAERVSAAVNPRQATVLGELGSVSDGTGQRGRHGARVGRAAADVVGDEKWLAFQLETVCVKCLTEEPVSVHEQHVSWMRIHGARQDGNQTLLGLAIQRSQVHTASITAAKDRVQEMMAVWQKRRISMRVLLEGCIDNRDRRQGPARRVH